MTRGAHADFLAEQRADETKPIVLLEIETRDTGEPWLYLTNQITPTTFPSGGTKYEPWPFELDEQVVGVDDDSAPKIRMADIYDDSSGTWVIDTWLASTDFRFHTVRVLQVQRDEFSAAGMANLDAYKVVNIARNGRVVTVDLTTIQGLLSRMRIPSGVLLRSEFPGIVKSQGVAI
jgi:hypothetical protein